MLAVIPPPKPPGARADGPAFFVWLMNVPGIWGPVAPRGCTLSGYTQSAAARALPLSPERHDICRLRLAPRRPSFHHRPPLFQRVAPTICRFRLVADRMRERRFAKLRREGRDFRRPIRKRRAKPVRGMSPRRPMRSSNISIAMLESGLPGFWPGNTKSEVLASESPFTIASARLDSATRCSRRAFIRSAGIVQSPASRSNSDHCAAKTSFVRVAVKIANSSASAASAGRERSSAMNSGMSV